MGLDVIFKKNGEDLMWNDPIMEDFPIPSFSESIPQYDRYDDGMPTGEYVHVYIPGVTGMIVSGNVSFRGRDYSSFANEVGLPSSFYTSLSPEEVKQQAKALEAYLKFFEGQPDETALPAQETLTYVRGLSKVLSWAAAHDLATSADY